MPRKSRHVSNLTIAIGGAFALLLLLSSALISQRRTEKKSAELQEKIAESPALPDEEPVIHTPEGDIAGVQEEKQPEENIPIEIDTSKWVKFKDAAYKFEIKFPNDWAKPAAKKINDPDFEYEYQVTFGTADTLAGGDFEGFEIFVFQSDRCKINGEKEKVADSQENSAAKCSTHLAKVPTGESSIPSFPEFSSKTYTYAIVPVLPADGADEQAKKTAAAIFSEAVKTFSFDPNIKLIPIAPKAQPAKPQPPRPQPATASRGGKLTGAKSAGGKLVCPHPGRKPKKSPNKGNHVDEDCCPDPDEWPNIACSYKASDFAIMLKR